MANATRATASKRTPMDPTRKTAITVGVLFVITFIAAIGGALLYGPVVDDPNYILGAGADFSVHLGALFELVLIISNIGTALVLFPLLRKQNEALALGFVAARIIECVFIAIGILALLAVVTLRQQAVAGADPNSLVAIGQSLVAINRWTFVLGPGFVVGIGNGLILGWLMYRSGLVPRRLALLALIGGPLVSVSGAAIVLGVIERGSAWQGLATVLEAVWEIGVLGVYIIVKGFNTSRAAVLQSREQGVAPAYAAA